MYIPSGKTKNPNDIRKTLQDTQIMKRFLSAAFLALSAVFIIFASKMTGRHFFSEFQISQTSFEALMHSRQKTDRISLLEVYFNEKSLFYDKSGDRWFYSISMNRESGESDISVAFSANINGLKIAFTGELSPGNAVRMIAYTDTEYRLYPIEVTSLPLIHIECGTENIPEYPAIPVRFTLFDNDPGSRQPVVKSDGTIHIRGKGSLSFPKKAFKLTLTTKTPGGEIIENQTALLGLRQDGDWHLYPAYDDQEKIRNVFSFALWSGACADSNSFGIKNGTEYRFAELFINHQYWGLYAIGYPIDAKQMKIRPQFNGHYEEFIFKQRAWGPPKGDYTSLENYLFSQFETDEADLNYGLSIMRMYFEHLDANAPNGLHNSDEMNAVDIWLFLKLTQDMDSLAQPGKIDNIIYTIKRSDTGRKIIYTPWDLDTTWGNYWGAYRMDPDDNTMEMDLNPVSVLLNQTETHAETAAMIRQRYRELRADGWSDHTVDQLLDKFEQDIYGSGAYIRDIERWPKTRQQDPMLALSHFRTYVHQRLSSMDMFIEGLE